MIMSQSGLLHENGAVVFVPNVHALHCHPRDLMHILPLSRCSVVAQGHAREGEEHILLSVDSVLLDSLPLRVWLRFVWWCRGDER
jgi:hypothetical protein